ncbi:hypothetical protein EV702DRAFT_1281187 [Suillus placidus]|uniref:Uncharacterized protein n=1 Tax=Suillus placidus TaxID=48579 RepID=A0A9P7CZK2_9AGAM|nr:hypothetical protein EV702DRAFT_1281187 [Suillus placidus]
MQPQLFILFTCYDALSAILPLVLGLPHSYLPQTLLHSTFCHYACVVSYINCHDLSQLTHHLSTLKVSSSFHISKSYSSPNIFHIYSNHGTSVFNPQVLCSHPDFRGSRRSSDVRPQDGLRKVLRQASLRKVRPLIARAAPAHPHKTNYATDIYI